MIGVITFTGIVRRKSVFIPHTLVITSDYNFQFKHFQFLVEIYYTITINKAQVRILKVVGMGLRTLFLRASYMWPVPGFAPPTP